MSLLTVVMPVYNGRQYVDEQIDSILSQEVPLSLIVLDDCSTDGSYEYLTDNYKDCQNILILKNDKNLGVIKSIEKLLGMVDTDFFALADQDDVWLKNKLKDSIHHLCSTDADLVYTDLKMVDGDLNQMHASKWVFSNTPPFEGRDPIPFVIKNPVTGCTVVGRKSLLDLALPFPDGIPMHDRWLAIAACAGAGVTFLDKPTMLYRQHSNNEVGGMPYGFRGLIARVNKDAKGSLSGYLRNRAERRLQLLESMCSMVDSIYVEKVDFLIVYYQSSWLMRVVLGWRYASILREYKVLGVKNILSDMLMGMLPYSSKHNAEVSANAKA